MSESRSRSASPVRDEPKPKKQKTGGFKWKEKKPKDEDKADDRDSGRLERGYRNRSPKRDSHRDRERENGKEKEPDRPPRREKDPTSKPSDPKPQAETDTSHHPPTKQDQISNTGNDVSSKFPGTKPADIKSDKPKKPKKPAAPTEPMIIVNINDRLGTKAAIPCLASDSIKAFKAVVAAHIGRQPHEIMLKRQGERPFKDQLTLQDYGVSNGVQLDLELDTGD